MGTLFLICVHLDKGRTLEIGPYLSLNEASNIFAEYIPAILRAIGIKTKRYKADIREVIPLNGSWEIIDIKVSATDTFCLEEFNESTS
jgi:hypothetical protein